MRMRRFLSLALTLALAACFFAALPSGAAEPMPGQPGRTEGPEWVGPPVTPSSWDGDIRDLPPIRPWKPGDPIIEIPRRFYANPAQALAHAPFWLDVECDPLVVKQAQFDAQRDRAEALPMGISTPIVNMDGIPHQPLSPPDAAGDVGPNHYVQAINGPNGSAVQIYDKAGNKIGNTFDMVSLGGTRPCTRTYGDPIVLYDRLADRWFLQEFTTSGGKSLCVHVSKTADPVSGGWWNYTFTQPTFPDYPHCAVWRDGYYCTANEGQSPIYVFDRANMLIGATTRGQQTFRATDLAGYGFQALTPVTFVGAYAAHANTPFIAVRHNDDEAHAGPAADPTRDFIDMFSVAVDWTTPANSVFFPLPKISIAEFNSWFLDYSTFATVPQPGSTAMLDPIREVILNRANYMNYGTYEAIVGTFATNIDPALTGSVVKSGVRWFELRRTPPGSGNWSLYQEGTYGDTSGTKHVLEGSVIMNKAGDLGFGFNVTQTVAPYVYASIMYSGRYSTDTADLMTQGENNIALGGGVETSGRWGDYPTMSLDPTDDCTFWFTHEYRPSGGWATRIASFKILPAAPAAPTLTSVTDTSLTVNWTAAGGAKSYDVYRAQGTTCSAAIQVNGSPVTGLSYADAGLSCETNYSYYVVAQSECGSSANGACNSVKTLTCCPVHVAPTITGANTNACPAEAVVLTTESGKTGYQWFKNGVAITGATSSQYAVTASGSYTVSYTEGGCSGTSAAKSVTISACKPDIVYLSHGAFTPVDAKSGSLMEAGDQWSVEVTLKNQGPVDAADVKASLSGMGAGDGITVCNNPGTFGTIPAGGTATCTYVFVLDPNKWYAPYTCGTDLTFNIVSKSTSTPGCPCADEKAVFSNPVGIAPGNETATQLTTPLNATSTSSNTILSPAFTLTSADTATLSYTGSYTQPSGTVTLFGPDDMANLSEWTATNATQATVATQTCGHSTKVAKLNGTSSSITLAYGLPAAGYTNIQLKFDWLASDVGQSGNSLTVEWSNDGNGWTAVGSPFVGATKDTWVCAQTVSLPSAAGLSGLKVRFTVSANNANRYDYVDYVSITGTAVASGTWTDNVQVSLVDPSLGVTVLKAFGASESGSYNVQPYYKNPGPGTYTLRLEENNGGTATLTGGTMTVTKGGTCDKWTATCSAVPPEAAPGDTLDTAQKWTDKNNQFWPGVSGTVTGYRLYRGQKADLANLLTANNNSCTRYEGVLTSALTSDDPTKLPTGDFFWYIVTAHNGSGQGPAGDASTSACPTPPCTRTINIVGDCPP